MKLDTPTKWCCFRLKTVYERPTERGVRFEFYHPNSSEQYAIVFRSVDPKDEEEVVKELAHTRIPLSLSSTLTISKCPWCGTDLRSFYGS